MKSYACLNVNFYYKNDRINSLNSSEDYEATISVIENLVNFCKYLQQKNLSLIKKKICNKIYKRWFWAIINFINFKEQERPEKNIRIPSKN